MSDGSTDVSVIENEIVYIHFCLGGNIHTYFLGLMECENANAEGIYMSILRALSFDCLCEEQIETSIIGFAADGASVNTGKCNGVIALFRRRINPNIVMVKCMSHRIELAYKDAMKKSPLYMKVFTLLDELFKFYGKSPKQMSGLKASFEDINQQQILPTRVGGTRWVGHLQTALRSMFKGYKGYVVHLEKVAAVRSGSSATQSKAKYLLKQMKAKDVMMFAHFVKDVVNVLSKLSKFMQARTTGVYQVHRELHNTITTLEKLETKPGPELRLFQQELQTEQSFQGYILEGSDAKCPEHISKVLAALVSSMSGRFNDIDSDILEATRIADLGSWPASFTEASDFGDEWVADLVNHFRSNLDAQDVDVGLIELEWTELKTNLYHDHVGSGTDVYQLSWPYIHQRYAVKCSNILHLMDLVMSLPSGSPECERGFSQMALMKTKYRNKLRSSTVTLLMTIQLHSDVISSFNPQPAIDKWASAQFRKPAFLKKCRAKKNVHVVEMFDGMYEEVREHSEQDAAAGDGASASVEAAKDEDSDYDSDFSDLCLDDELSE